MSSTSIISTHTQKISFYCNATQLSQPPAAKHNQTYLLLTKQSLYPTTTNPIYLSLPATIM